jgi:hypothetical protein
MDHIYGGFLEQQHVDISALVADSDRFVVRPLPGRPAPSRYLVRFHCTGMVCDGGEPQISDGPFDLGIWMPEDYLRRVNPAQVLTWLGPRSIWHPNIGPVPRTPQDPIFICPGRLALGTPLVDLVYQCWEIITFNKVTMLENDALNKPACAWARANQDRFPLDNRPLRRTQFEVDALP